MSDTPLLVRALRREPVERTPIWLMRQAGRYMPEYRAVRKDVDFLTLCHTSELAAKVTLEAVEILDVDAAILFSDILVPAEAMGAEVQFIEKGPSIANPIRSARDVEELRVPVPEEDLPFVAETLRAVRAALPAEKALIGFAGAPFTVASYMVEGQSTRDYVVTKSLMLREPAVFHALLERIAEGTIACLRAQVEAGAEALQLFDSWAGFLAPPEFEEFALRHARTVFEGIRDLGVPTIHYANGTGGVLEATATVGADCISVDWRIELAEAWRRIGHDKAIQGNLDPIALYGPPESIEARAKAILDAAEGRPGHVFNLGHGIHKETPVDHVLALIDAVKRHGVRS